MTKASDATAEALRRIVVARETGAASLYLSDLRALTSLPKAIATLDRLRNLDLRRTGIRNLAPLAQLPALTTLNLAGTKVTDLRPLAQLAALTTLDLGNTPITDLSPLALVAALTTLDLSHTPVIDLSPLTQLTDLTTLDLRNTQVTDLSPLAQFAALIRLELSSTPVTDLRALAQLSALTTLDLSGTKVTDLSPLAQLSALTTLNLSSTKVTDLSPLARLPGLSMLNLRGTKLTDVAPLAALPRLRDLDLTQTRVTREGLRALAGLQMLTDPRHENHGLHFAGSAATRTDPRLEEISFIASGSARARALFDHLGLPVDDADAPPQPDPDPLLAMLIVDGRLEVAADAPAAAEHLDAVKQAVHPRLRDRAAGLAGLAHNRLPRLNCRAAALRILLDRPFADLDLLAVHFEVEELNDRAARGHEDGEPFGSDVAEALSDIARLGPGLTRDHAAVELHEERLARRRANPPAAADTSARAALSDVILARPAAHGPRSLALERAMADATDPTRADALRQPKYRNMLWRLGVTAALRTETLGLGVAGGVLANNYGPAITAFVNANWPLLMTVAQTYGAPFAAWFAATVGVGLFGKGVVEVWRKCPPGK